jgi:hypothetical protein
MADDSIDMFEVTSLDSVEEDFNSLLPIILGLKCQCLPILSFVVSRDEHWS